MLLMLYDLILAFKISFLSSFFFFFFSPKILHKGELGHIYNIGTPREVSNLEVAHQLGALFGHKEGDESYITFVENRMFNDFRYKLNTDKLVQLGWQPEVTFEDGLRRTVEWYAVHCDNWTTQQLQGALVPHPRLQGSLGEK